MKTDINIIPNGDFNRGQIGSVPEGWEVKSIYPNLSPAFKLVEFDGKNATESTGDGNPNCIGHLCANVRLQGGQTYLFKVLFHISNDINPQSNLLFSVNTPDFTIFNNGIYKFKKLDNNWVVGEN